MDAAFKSIDSYVRRKFRPEEWSVEMAAKHFSTDCGDMIIESPPPHEDQP